MKRNWLKWAWTAFAVTVLYVVVVWLLNADFVGIELMLRLHGFWAEVYYWSIFVAVYAGAVLLLLIGVTYSTRWFRRRA